MVEMGGGDSHASSRCYIHLQGSCVHRAVVVYRRAGTGPAGPVSAGPIITNVFGFFSAVK